jgi:hypothetical protein
VNDLIDDLEVELRAAIDAGDSERCTALGEQIDRLDQHPPPVTMLSAALWYAAQGLRVFPLAPGSKIPHKGSAGCTEATSDPEQIRAWWGRWPDSNVAIATGHIIDVVDVDGPAGQKSRAEHWDDIFANVDADNVGKVLTPRPGGMHIYVPATGDRNSANICPGIDYRGSGGYVCAPPSVNPEGTYRWLGTPRIKDMA